MPELPVSTKTLIAIGDREYLIARDHLLTQGFELPHDAVDALAWCRSQATAGTPIAQFILAKFLHVGLFVQRDEREALDWCRKAADQDFPPAILKLAGFYESGWADLPVNESLAVQLIRRAADKDYAVALGVLGSMYSTGHLVDKEPDKAILLLERAAKLGDTVAQCQLSAMLLEKNDSTSVAAGIQWLRRAASQDSSSAHRRLAYFHMDGSFGVSKDPELSRHHMRIADELESE